MSNTTVMAPHGSAAFHGGLWAPNSKYYNQGKFGRLFPTLPAHFPKLDNPADRPDKKFLELGKASGIMDPGAANNLDNSEIPAGFVFFGQFVDHDITFDPTSSLERQNDPEAIQNFRTPALELDSVYGSGPGANPHLYQKNKLKLLIDTVAPDDLPRNSLNTALIGDPRNDENMIISQLHLAFLKFHNAVVDNLPATTPNRFERAQQLVRWHYQWIVLHQFLPLIVGQDLVNEIYLGPCNGIGRQFFDWRHEPFIPVEFAVAAYRFGHTQIPGTLQVNDSDFKVDGNSQIPLFDPDEIGDADPDDLSGGVRAPRRFVQWKYFFDTGDGVQQPSKRLDTVLSGPLFDLPFLPPEETVRSLAQRNLVRGLSFALPAGQTIARAMCIDPLAPSDLADVASLGFDAETPLWFYILREADVQQDGKILGPVGGRIVAEVLVGLLEGDRNSFLRAFPKWQPDLGPAPGQFGLTDLLQIAGVLS